MIERYGNPAPDGITLEEGTKAAIASFRQGTTD